MGNLKPYGGGLKPYYPNPSGPVDLSNVLSTAGQIGRDTGFNEFYANLEKQRRDRLKAAQEARAAEQKAATEDLGNEPDSEGFWSRLGDGALHGAQWLVDKLSRPNYAMANMYKHLNEQQREYEAENLSFWERTKEDFADIPDALREAKEGFTGKDKVYFAEVLADKAKHDGKDNFKDSGWYQGTMGLTMDIFLDPTTYVGAGVVKKPLGVITREAGEAIAEHKAAALAKDIAELGVKEGDVALDHKQVYALITGKEFGKKGAARSGAITAAERAEHATHYADNVQRLKDMLHDVPIDTSELDDLTKSIDDLHVRWNKELDEVEQAAMRTAAHQFDTEMGAAVGKSAEEVVSHEGSVSKIVEDALELNNAAHAFGNEGWRRYLVGQLDKLRLGAKAGKDNAEKIARTEENLAKIGGEESKFDELLGVGDAWKADERLPKNLREDAFKVVNSLASSDPAFRAENEKLFANFWSKEPGEVRANNVGLVEQLNNAKADLKTARNAGDHELAGRLEQSIEALDKSVKAAYRKRAHIMAGIFARLVGGHTGQYTAAFSDDVVQELMQKQGELETALAKWEQLGENSPAVGHSSELGEGAARLDIEASAANKADPEFKNKYRGDIDPELKVGSGYGNEGLQAKRDVERLQREIDQIINKAGIGSHGDKIKIPEGLPVGKDKPALVDKSGAPTELFKALFSKTGGRIVVKDGLSKEHDGFARDILTEIESKQATIRNQKIKTWGRSQREAHKEEITPNDLKEMFGYNKRGTVKEGNVLGKVPRLKTKGPDGKPILKTDKAALAAHVTDEDRALAQALSNGSSVLGMDDVIKYFAKDLPEFLGRFPDTKKAILKILRDPNVTVKNPEGIYNYLRTLPRVADEEMDEAFDYIVKVKRFAEDQGIGLKGSERITAASVAPEHVAFDRMFLEQYGKTVRSAAKWRKNPRWASEAGHADLKAATQARSLRLPFSQKTKFEAEAWDEATSAVSKSLSQGTLHVTDLSRRVMIRSGGKVAGQEVAKEGSKVTAAQAKAAARKKAEERGAEQAKQIAHERNRMQYINDKAKARREKGSKSAQEMKKKLDELRAERDLKKKAIDEAFHEAKLTRVAMADRLDEQLLLDMLVEPTLKTRRAMKLTFAGKTLGIGSKHVDEATGMRMASFTTPKMLDTMTEKIGGIGIIKSTREKWAEAFAPASKLAPELNEARLRMQGNVNDVIKHHLDEIFKAFNKFAPKEREQALRAMLKGAPVGNTELYETTKKIFDDFVQYTNGTMKIGGNEADDVLRLDEINHYLPDEFKFVPKEGGSIRNHTLHTGREIVEHMRNAKETDPMKVIWHLRIATEKAMAAKAMRFTIAESFGVKRILADPLHGLMTLNESDAARREIIEALKEKHNWTTVDGFHEKYYFEQSVAKDISKLMDMMKPERTQDIMRTYDKVLRAWKSSVTVYNPGYYSRNAIGEVMMGMMDGVGPRYYGTAGKILMYAQPDGVKEALKSITPWKKFATTAQQGSRTAVKGKFGKISYEQAWVLFHEHNLKSGFISTEMDHWVPAMNSMRATPVGQVATKINDYVRGKGEKFEDFFRMAHFLDRMARSNERTIEAAAREASRYVRKYHFDYTDFTPFEKTKMMRVIPFYKWTRKAMPLMTGMLFTKPGAVNFYPKVMSNVSVATGGTDPLTDENGFQPNYEGVVPEWIQALMAYPVGTPDANGDQDYMHVATPAFDVYKMIQNPVSATIGMLSPGIKFPFEQGTGETMDPNFKMDVKTGDERFDNAARLTPLTSLLNNIRKGSAPGEDSAIVENGRMDEKMLSFLTGLGFYENNEKRQQGEQLRQAKEGK